MSTSAARERVVRCPACAGPALYSEHNRWRPFCSERCRNHDLGAWASEGYRVPAGTPLPEAGADDGEPAPSH